MPRSAMSTLSELGGGAMADSTQDVQGAQSPAASDAAAIIAVQPSGAQGQERSHDAGKLKVFISYSRDDLKFADQLDAALSLTGFDVAIDRHGIDAGENWKRRLGQLIRDTDTVIFVVSPFSAGSEICAWEVEEALRLSKRILPVVCDPLNEAAPPPKLQDLNYIFFYDEPRAPGSGFGVGLARLVEALNTDVEWIREHTRLLARATEWNAYGRPKNRLLFGSVIADANAWAARRPKNAPGLTPLHLDYIRASEEGETLRTDEARQQLARIAAAQEERARALADIEAEQKRRARLQRVLVAGAVVVALGFATFAVFSWSLYLTAEARKNEAVALDARAVAQARLAEAKAQEAEEQKQQAQNNLAAARGAISTLVEVISETVQPIAQLDQVQSLIDQVRQMMNTFATFSKDPAFILQNARTLLILADIDSDRGQIGRMREEAETAFNDLAPLVKSGDLEARHQRARAYSFMGLAAWDSYKNEEARDLYTKGIDDLQQMLIAFPNDRSRWQWEASLSDLNQELGDVLLFRLADPEAALAAFEACHNERLRVREFGQHSRNVDVAIAWAENKFGDVQWRLGNIDAALNWFLSARDVFVGLGDHVWDNVRWPHELSLIYNDIGLANHRRSQFREADAAFEQAEALLVDVAKRDPNNLFRLSALAWTRDNRGEALMRLALQTNDRRALEIAKQILALALEIREKLHESAPDKLDYQLSVVDTKANIASAEAATKQLLGDHLAAAKTFQSAADFILDGYSARALRRPALLRAIDFLDLASLEYGRAHRGGEGRAVLTRALELARTNEPTLGNLYTDLAHGLLQHLNMMTS
jgi:hypothetical protein